jgi:hypothetical protein
MGEEGEIADTWALDDTVFSERLSNQTKYDTPSIPSSSYTDFIFFQLCCYTYVLG